jgi:hypothetical protein
LRAFATSRPDITTAHIDPLEAARRRQLIRTPFFAARDASEMMARCARSEQRATRRVRREVPMPRLPLIDFHHYLLSLAFFADILI